MTDRAHIEKMRETLKRTLHLLEEQRAELGQLCPPSIIIAIQDTQAEIVELEAQLGLGAPAEAQSNLPRLSYFFGREEELTLIAKSLVPDTHVWGAQIYGQGGIGKTTLAIQAAVAAPVDLFPHKIFVTAKEHQLAATGKRTLHDFNTTDYMAILTELGSKLEGDTINMSDSIDLSRVVCDRLSRQRALLVFDNLETLKKEERERLFQFLNHLPRTCKALVTSRHRSNDINAYQIEVNKLDQADALDLINELVQGNLLQTNATLEERIELYNAAQGNPLLIHWIAGQLGLPESECNTVADACHFLERAPDSNNPLEYIFSDLIGVLTPNETLVLASLSHFRQPASPELVAEIAGLPLSITKSTLKYLRNRALLAAYTEDEGYVLPAIVATFVRRKLHEQLAQSSIRLLNRILHELVPLNTNKLTQTEALAAIESLQRMCEPLHSGM
jgi:hypothetical protein